MDPFKRAVRERAEEVYELAKMNHELLGPCGYRIAITALFGYTPSEWETSESFRDGRGASLKDFKRFVERKLEHMHPEQYLQDVLVLFDKDCKGFVSLEDALAVWNDLSERPSWAKIRQSFRAASARGTIGYAELREAFRSRAGGTRSDHHFPSELEFLRTRSGRSSTRL